MLISSSHNTPKIGHGDSSQLFRRNRMTAASVVASEVNVKLNIRHDSVEGKFSDLPSN
jgi:hypothetical protein